MSESDPTHQMVLSQVEVSVGPKFDQTMFPYGHGDAAEHILNVLIANA